MKIEMIFIKKHCKFLLLNDENHVYFYEYGYCIVVVGVGKHWVPMNLSIRIPTVCFACKKKFMLPKTIYSEIWHESI